MHRLVHMTEHRKSELNSLAIVLNVSIAFSGLDDSIVTIANRDGTSYEMYSCLAFGK